MCRTAIADYANLRGGGCAVTRHVVTVMQFGHSKCGHTNVLQMHRSWKAVHNSHQHSTAKSRAGQIEASSDQKDILPSE
eukprot:2852888-Heterocapsa_arctica.AAC.1